jgi:drug/metabolite transporter (DMT)-like permease
MVKFYAICLALGIAGLLVVVLGGAFAENVGRPERDPGRRIGAWGRSLIGGLLGFGMAGMSAEFSVSDLSWQTALLLAIAGGGAGVVWAWYASTRDSGSDAGPV